MPEKIIVVSMAKNEADIIESFVRYYMTFADGMIIVDHNSDDATSELLAELQKEYPSLIVDQLQTIEHVQSEVMTKLMKIAANELGANWILPIDIDEFLITKEDIDCRAMLGRITDDVVSVDWIDYELVNPDHDRDMFLLSRLCNRSTTVRTMKKIFVKGSFVKKNDFKLVQGNHGVMVKQDDGTDQIIVSPRLSECLLAHFPFRSKEQYISKNTIGWLTNAMKYSRTTTRAPHWHKAFEKICGNDDDMPTIENSQFVGKLYPGTINLKYTDSKPINVFSRLMKLAEKICDRYARDTALNKISPVTVVMPLGQDLDATVVTIESLLHQTLHEWNLLIVAPSDLDKSVRSALAECDNRIKIVGINDDVNPEGYVKLITPGRKLSPECLEMEAVALYNHNEFNLTYSNGKDTAGADVVVKIVSAQPGIDAWNAIKDQPYSLTGGISGMMIRKLPHGWKLSKVIENYMWKEKEILGMLLPDNLMFVFTDRLV